MQLILTNLLALLIGLITSYLFLRWQLWVVPKVSISPYITYSTRRHSFKFKLANESRRQVTDIEIKMAIMRRDSSRGYSRLAIVRRLDLFTPKIMVLSGSHQNDPWTFINTLSVRTKRDDEALSLLRNALDGEERRIVCTIQVVDGLSRTKVVLRKTYTYKDVVIDGEFGKKFTLMRDNVKSDKELLRELLDI